MKTKDNVENQEMEKDRKKKPNLFETFTKLWVTILLIIALIDLQISYILAFLGMANIAESLSIAIVTEIIGVAGIYMIRAFFDTVSEKKHEISMMTSTKSESILESEENLDEDDCG